MPVMGNAFKTIAHAAVKSIQRARGDEQLAATITRIFVSDGAFKTISKANGAYGVPQFRSGLINAQFFVRTKHGEDPSRDGAQPLGFELGFAGRGIAWLATRVVVLVYSKSGTGLLLPWMMAVVAGGLACRKIMAAW